VAVDNAAAEGSKCFGAVVGIAPVVEMGIVPAVVVVRIAPAMVVARIADRMVGGFAGDHFSACLEAVGKFLGNPP